MDEEDSRILRRAVHNLGKLPIPLLLGVVAGYLIRDSQLGPGASIFLVIAMVVLGLVYMSLIDQIVQEFRETRNSENSSDGGMER